MSKKKNKSVFMKPGVYAREVDLSAYLPDRVESGKIYPPVDVSNQLLGVKGANFLDAGYIFAPYMPLHHTTIKSVDDFRRGMYGTAEDPEPDKPQGPQWFDILVAALQDAAPDNMTVELDVESSKVDIVCENNGEKHSVCYIEEKMGGGFRSNIVKDIVDLAKPGDFEEFEVLLTERIEGFKAA